MNPISLTLGLGAIVLLFAAGYLYGVRRGFEARERLREEVLRFAQHIQGLEALVSERTHDRDEALRSEIQQLLAPLVQHEQISANLAGVKVAPSRNRDLPLLLDHIAEAGNFSTVLLSNEDGLTLAASRSSSKVEQLAAVSSLLLLATDKIAGADSPPIQSVMLFDEAERTLLSRIFRAHGRRFSLIAVASGSKLTPTVLDPAVAKIDAALSTPG
jgi:hypothetical protein